MRKWWRRALASARTPTVFLAGDEFADAIAAAMRADPARWGRVIRLEIRSDEANLPVDLRLRTADQVLLAFAWQSFGLADHHGERRDFSLLTDYRDHYIGSDAVPLIPGRAFISAASFDAMSPAVMELVSRAHAANAQLVHLLPPPPVAPENSRLFRDRQEPALKAYRLSQDVQREQLAPFEPWTFGGDPGDLTPSGFLKRSVGARKDGLAGYCASLLASMADQAVGRRRKLAA